MNALTHEIEESISLLTEYWFDRKELVEEVGYNDDDGFPILNYDGWFEYEKTEERVANFITSDIRKTMVTIKSYVDRLDPDASFSFTLSFHSFITQQKLYLEQVMGGIETYEPYRYSVSPGLAYSNLRILESVINGFFSNYLLFSSSRAAPNSNKHSNKNGIKKTMEIKDFLMWVRIPLMTKHLELEKGYLKQFITEVGKLCGLDIKKGYASNINLAIESGHYHDMINDLLKLIQDYERGFNQDQSRKNFGRDSGIKLNNN